jgi:predicted transcriptional regulator
MTVEQVVRALGLNVRSGAFKLDQKVDGVYVSDLLSDVMANAKQGNIWITLQVHQNVVAVATLLNLSGVIISRGAEPDEATIAKAEQEEVLVLTSPEPTFEVAGRLYQLLSEPDAPALK